MTDAPMPRQEIGDLMDAVMRVNHSIYERVAAARAEHELTMQKHAVAMQEIRDCIERMRGLSK